MDKLDAIKRIDAIENDVMELREIIKKKDKIKFERNKLYIGLKDGTPFILVGNAQQDHHRFQSFDEGNFTYQGWDNGMDSADECIEYHIERGFDIHVFDDVKKGFEFFLEHYKG